MPFSKYMEPDPTFGTEFNQEVERLEANTSWHQVSSSVNPSVDTDNLSEPKPIKPVPLQTEWKRTSFIIEKPLFKAAKKSRSKTEGKQPKKTKIDPSKRVLELLPATLPTQKILVPPSPDVRLNLPRNPRGKDSDSPIGSDSEDSELTPFPMLKTLKEDFDRQLGRFAASASNLSLSEIEEFGQYTTSKILSFTEKIQSQAVAKQQEKVAIETVTKSFQALSKDLPCCSDCSRPICVMNYLVKVEAPKLDFDCNRHPLCSSCATRLKEWQACPLCINE
jgi:hypothetical protein